MSLHKVTIGICIAAFTALISSASTITLIGTMPGDQPNGGSPNTWTGPYLIDDDGVQTPATCIIYNRTVSIGETWNATAESVVGLPDETLYLEAEYLNLQFSVDPGSVVNIQEAIWDLFDPGVFAESTWLGRAEMEWWTVNPYSFDVLIPNGVGEPEGTTPQSFLIPIPAAATPEPSTFLPLLVGILALAKMRKRRKR